MIHHHKALHQIVKRYIPRRLRRTRVVLAGCGQVGMSICESAKNVHCIAAYRGPAVEPNQTSQQTDANASDLKKQMIHSHGANSIHIDLNHYRQLAQLLSLSHRVVWLAPPSTKTNDNILKKAIGLMALRHQKYGHQTKPQLVYVSTTGVYGNTNGAWVNELSPVNPESARAKRRVEAEQQVRTGLKRNIDIAILRAPGIYSHKRLPKERLLQGLPALTPEEDAWSNHIHEHDLARLCVWIQFKNKTVRNAFRLVNACDAEPMKMGDYFDLVADHLSLPRPPRMNAQNIQNMVSPMMWSFMRESRKVESKGLKQYQFSLKYQNVASALMPPHHFQSGM